MQVGFRLAVLPILLVVSVLVFTSSGAAGAGLKPHRLLLMINGKRVPLQPIVGGEDDYVPYHSDSIAVSARWTGRATGSGYFVRISTREPTIKVYARCFTGTTCRVPGVVPVAKRVYLSWRIEVVQRKSGKVVAGYQYCLERGHDS